MSDAIPPVPVQPQRPGQDNSPIRDAEPTNSRVGSSVVICHWNGQVFTSGLRVVADGEVYECRGGPDGPFWRPTGETC